MSLIRKREEKDENAIVDVWFEASNLAHSFLASDYVEKEKRDLREVYLPNAETWVYEDDNTVVGFISMLGNEIGGLFVLPSHHTKGIGTSLVNFVKERYGELELEVFEENQIGRAFYQKYGFKQIKSYHHTESKCEMLRLRYKGYSLL